MKASRLATAVLVASTAIGATATNINMLSAKPLVEGRYAMAAKQKLNPEAEAQSAISALRSFIENPSEEGKRNFLSILHRNDLSEGSAFRAAYKKKRDSDGEVAPVWNKFKSDFPSPKPIEDFLSYIEKTHKVSGAKIIANAATEKDLSEAAAKLSEPKKNAYNGTELGMWLRSKVPSYYIDVDGVAGAIVKVLADKSYGVSREQVTTEWLDKLLAKDPRKLEGMPNLRDFMRAKVTFAPEKFAEKIVLGNMADIPLLMLASPIGDSKSNTLVNNLNDFEKARVMAVEFTLKKILDSRESGLSGLKAKISNAIGKTSEILANGQLSNAERGAIDTVRKYLISEMVDNAAYGNALSKAGIESIGIASANPAEKGQVDQSLAIALGTYISIALKGEKATGEQLKKLGTVAPIATVQERPPGALGTRTGEAPAKPEFAIPAETVASYVASGDLVKALTSSGTIKHSIGAGYTTANAKSLAEKERIKAVKMIYNSMIGKMQEDDEFWASGFATPGRSPYLKIAKGVQVDGNYDENATLAVKAMQNFLKVQMLKNENFGRAVSGFNAFIGKNSGDLGLEPEVAQAAEKLGTVATNGIFTAQTVGACVIYLNNQGKGYANPKIEQLKGAGSTVQVGEIKMKFIEPPKKESDEEKRKRVGF